MPNFDPAQELPDDQTVITVPVSLPNQFGGVVTGPPTSPDPGAALAAAARGETPQFQTFPGMGGSPAPPPVPIEPPPIAPPLAGGPPPPAATAIPAAPPPAPRARPDTTDALIGAGFPVGPGGQVLDQPPTGQPPPAAPGEPKPGDLAAGAARATSAEAEHEAALRKQGEVEQANAAAEAQARQRIADEAAKRQAVQEQARAESDRAIQAAREAAQKRPYHSFWADKSFAQRGLAMLGIMLGGISWDKNHRNAAADGLDQAIAQDFQRQREEHAELWRNVEAAQQQGQALRANQLQEMGEFRKNQALQLDAVIAKGNQLAANSKNAVGVAAWKEQAAKYGFERDKAINEATRLDAEARQREHYQNEELKIQRGHLGVARENAKRAGEAGQYDRFVKEAGKAFPVTKDAAKAAKVADDADSLVKMLKENPSSLASSLGLERMVSVFSGGGKASVQALKMVKPNAGSVLDIGIDDLSRALTGNQGTAVRQHILKVAEEEAKHSGQVVEDTRKRGKTALARLSKLVPGADDDYLTGILGPPRNTAAAGPTGKHVKLKDGRTGTLTADGTFYAD